MSKTPPAEPMTYKAVAAYVAQLAVRGELARARDPYATPYEPTDAAAKRVYHFHLADIRGRDDANPDFEPDETTQVAEACQLTIQTLAGRVREKERDHQEDELASKRALERHQRRQRQSERDRTARRLALSPGQRLDRALGAFSTVSAVGASQVGWSTPSSERGPVVNHGDPAGEAKHIAIKAIQEIEALLDRHQLRDVHKAA